MRSKFKPFLSPVLWIVVLKLIIYFTLWFAELKYGYRMSDRVGWFGYGADAHSYLDPVESLIDFGYYGARSPSAFRMPGMFPFYGPLYFLFGKEIGLLSLGILMGILDALGVFLVYKTLKYLAVSSKFSLLFSLLYALYPRISSFGYLGMTETAAAFFCILIVYLLIRFLKSDQQSKLNLFIIGVSLAQLVFLKPITILYAPILPLLLFQRYGIVRFKRILLGAVIMISPVIISISSWTIRNYISFDKTIPLTDAFEDSGPDMAFKYFCRTLGLEFQTFSRQDVQVWFLPPDHSRYNEDFAAKNPFPDYVFTSEFNFDSLLVLRDEWIESKSASSNSNYLASRVEDKFNGYAQSFKRENPISFVFRSRLNLLFSFFFIRDSFSPFAQSTFLFLVLRLYYFLTYYTIVILGITGLIASFISRKRGFLQVGVLILVFVGAHVSIGIVENRYLLPIIPLLAIISASPFQMYREKND